MIIHEGFGLFGQDGVFGVLWHCFGFFWSLRGVVSFLKRVNVYNG